MRRLQKPFAKRLVALALGALILTWGVGANVTGAQEHHGDHGHGGHGGHDSTTTTRRPGSSTTRPTTPTTQPGTQRTTVRYGPYNQPPAQPGSGHHGTEVPGLNIGVQKPCTNCYITRMQADLVKADGTRAGYSNGVMLHHMVMFNRETGRSDATCANSGLGIAGQRFFASGDERTVSEFPAGYGYRIGANSTWILIWELMTMSTVQESAYITVTYDWVPDSTPNMTDVEPVWMDIDQCADSEVTVPAGTSSQNYTWTVNRPGNIVSIGGHLHDYGTHLEIRNVTTNQLICDSVAGYGESPLYIDEHGMEHISSMSGCLGNPNVASVSNGQQVRITSHYDAPEPQEGAMGISVAYIAQGGGTGGGGGGGGGGSQDCVSGTNQQHVAAGRATAWLVFAWAKGSNQYLGMTWATTSLRQTQPGNWSMVTSC